MRGKDLRLLLSWALIGITPAYAGKRQFIFVLFKPAQDHPRVCGEKHAHLAPAAGVVGSPPRMRGKDLRLLLSWALIGITPAHAGKSSG